MENLNEAAHQRMHQRAVGVPATAGELTCGRLNKG